MTFPSLPARMAWRYLRAPKSHSAVSAISVISVVGVAVATAAIICVLSVFNGFRGLLEEKLDILAPDVLVEPASGKTFADADSLRQEIMTVKGVATVMPTVTDNALAIVDGREMPVTLKGVETDIYPTYTSIDSILVGKTPRRPAAARRSGLGRSGDTARDIYPRRRHVHLRTEKGRTREHG